MNNNKKAGGIKGGVEGGGGFHEIELREDPTSEQRDSGVWPLASLMD